MSEDNDMLCPWCLGELPGKPGQVAKCRHCGSDIHWGDGKPYKTKFQAAQPNPVVRDVPVNLQPTPRVPIEIENESGPESSFVMEDVSEIIGELHAYEKANTQRKKQTDTQRKKQADTQQEKRITLKRDKDIKWKASWNRLILLLRICLVICAPIFVIPVLFWFPLLFILISFTSLPNEYVPLIDFVFTTDFATLFFGIGQLPTIAFYLYMYYKIKKIGDNTWKKNLDTSWGKIFVNYLSFYEKKSFKHKEAEEKVHVALQKNKGREKEVLIVLTAAISIGCIAFWRAYSVMEPQIKLEREEQLKNARKRREILSQAILAKADKANRIENQIRILSECRSIDKEAAQRLVKLRLSNRNSQNKGLSLNSLTSIDKDVAKELAVLKNLSFNSLASIDKDVVKELVNIETLWLNGLTLIDKDVAQELAKFEGESLYLNGLKSIDKDVAQELAKLEGERLSLNGLKSIDKNVAQELAKFEGENLSLYGLESIDKDVAQELAKFEGESLYLHGLTSIDKEVLDVLKSIPKILLPHKYRD